MMSNDSIYTALSSYTQSLSVALGYRDLLTRLHSDRVRALSEAIGVQYGLTSQKLNILKDSFHVSRYWEAWNTGQCPDEVFAT